MTSKEKILYPFYVIAHPFDGFYEIRHREKGSVTLSLFIIFMFGLSFSINKRYAGFVVNFVNPRYVDSRADVMGILLAAILFAIANWSITSLTEGEGRFKDIIIVVGYSMLPMVLTFLPATFISHFVASNEEGIYYLLMSISILLFVLLVVIGIMIIHNFGFGKTIFTIILTFIALLLIIFIALLLSSLINQVYMFLKSVYTELILRL